jgi:hypothetical protein
VQGPYWHGLALIDHPNRRLGRRTDREAVGFGRRRFIRAATLRMIDADHQDPSRHRPATRQFLQTPVLNP